MSSLFFLVVIVFPGRNMHYSPLSFSRLSLRVPIVYLLFVFVSLSRSVAWMHHISFTIVSILINVNWCEVQSHLFFLSFSLSFPLVHFVMRDFYCHFSCVSLAINHFSNSFFCSYHKFSFDAVCIANRNFSPLLITVVRKKRSWVCVAKRENNIQMFFYCTEQFMLWKIACGKNFTENL